MSDIKEDSASCQPLIGPRSGRRDLDTLTHISDQELLRLEFDISSSVAVTMKKNNQINKKTNPNQITLSQLDVCFFSCVCR